MTRNWPGGRRTPGGRQLCSAEPAARARAPRSARHGRAPGLQPFARHLPQHVRVVPCLAGQPGGPLLGPGQPARLSTSRWMTAVAGSGWPSPARAAAATVTGTPSRWMNRSQWASAGPARWASSIIITTGPCPASRASTRARAAYSTAGPSMLSASTGGGGGPAGPPSSGASSVSSLASRSAAASGPSRRSSAVSARRTASSGSAAAPFRRKDRGPWPPPRRRRRPPSHPLPAARPPRPGGCGRSAAPVRVPQLRPLAGQRLRARTADQRQGDPRGGRTARGPVALPPGPSPLPVRVRRRSARRRGRAWPRRYSHSARR